MDSKDLKELSALYLDSVYLNEKDTPDQVKAVIAYDKARKGTEDAVYDTEHGKKKQAKKERDYAKWQRDKGAEDAQKSGHPWEHAKGSTREKEGKKSEKHAHIKDSFEPSELIQKLVESGKFSEQDIENITEILGAALGGIAGHTMLAPALAKGGAAAALTKAGVGPGIAKALTGKTASAALGSAAGEVLDPTKKQKDKNPVSAAAGGAAGSAAAGALAKPQGVVAGYEPEGDLISENPIMNFLNPDPSKSNEPSVRSGHRTPKTAGITNPKNYQRFDKSGKNLGYDYGQGEVVKQAGKAISGAAKAGMNALKNAPPLAKAGLVGAAALGTKAVVDTVMGHGKNSNGKNSNEEFEFANKLIESGMFSEEEIKIILWNEGYQRNPEKGEAEERKAEKSRKESGRMPPRGDKRREDFEKWYAANVK